MEHCPIEVWQRIMTFACTDGGYTGNSLSLVSRFMRNTALPVRFHSIAVTAEYNLLTLSKQLSRLSGIVNIRHLFISVYVVLWGPRATPEERRSSLKSAIEYILTRAAPTLCTLILHRPEGFGILQSALHFPALTDLSLPSLRPHDALVDAMNTGEHVNTMTRRPFPVVERLHLTDCFATRDAVWDDICNLFPTITALQLSGVQNYSSLPIFLRTLLNVPDHKHLPGCGGNDAKGKASHSSIAATIRAAELRAHLSNLRCVSVQPAILEDDEWCSTGPSAHALMVDGLHCIVRCCVGDKGPGRGRFCLERMKPYTTYEALGDWLSIVNGGDGPWASGSEAQPPPRGDDSV